MKTILHERLRRAFPVLLLMASMLVVGVGEAKAWVVTEPQGETPTLNEVVITGQKSFVESHQGAHVILEPEAIYTIEQEGASISKLTVKDGAQLCLRQPLTVTDSVIIESYVETDKWTTFCTPIDMDISGDCRWKGYESDIVIIYV